MTSDIERISYRTVGGIECVAHPQDDKNLWEYLLKERGLGKVDIIVPDELFFDKNVRVWRPEDGVRKTTEYLKNISLPKVPDTFGEAYTFPEDVSKLTMIDLGRWMFKLASWRAYCLRILTFEELDYNINKKAFDLAINNKAAETEKIQVKRVSKDFLISSIILGNKVYKSLQFKLFEQETKIKALQKILDLYQIQAECMSRELTRRDLVLKESH